MPKKERALYESLPKIIIIPMTEIKYMTDSVWDRNRDLSLLFHPYLETTDNEIEINYIEKM